MSELARLSSETDFVSLLASTDLFCDVDPLILRDLEPQFKRVRVAGGETLLRQGERGDCLFVLISGRLRVFVERPDGSETVVGEVARGEVVGEMSILTDEPRSATVKAIRDSELAMFSRETLQSLLERHPRVMMQITRQIIARLQRSTGVHRASNTVKTLTLIPAGGGGPLRLFAERLAETLARFGPTLHLTSERVNEYLGHGAAEGLQHGPGGDRIVGWLNEQELRHNCVIYEADPVRSNWTRRCVRQADTVLAVGSPYNDPALGPIEEELLRSGSSANLAWQDLVLVYEDGNGRPRATHEWLRRRPIRRHHHVRLASTRDFERLARILTGRGVGIVLGGGGARGLSHVGTLRALEDFGVPIDAIGGTSMGAIISAMRAMDMDYSSLYETCKAHFVREGSLLDFTFPMVSLTAGGRIARRLNAVFGNLRIEDLWLNYYCVSSNLTRAEPAVHRDGLLWKRIRASISLPGILPPVFDDGNLLVDGGVINNLPVDVMRSLCEGGTVIALDVTPKVDLAHRDPFPEAISGWRLLARRLNPFGTPMAVPQLMSVLVRTTLLGSVTTQNLMASRADLVLRPPLEKFGLLDFKSFDQIVDIGYQHAMERLEAWSASKQKLGMS